MYLTAIFIMLVVVYVVDLSGFVQSVKHGLWRLIKGEAKYTEFDLKPFDCSQCVTFWASLLWAIFSGGLTWGVVLWICVLAYSARTVGEIWRALFEALENLIGKLINKIVEL